VALSFDDGPDERYTPEILDILKAANVPAIFFVVGINVENNVGLLKRIYDEGHEIGNHTFTHPNLALVNPERTRVELQATRRIIESITGHSTILFRPPYNADSEPESMEELLPVEVGKEENYYTVAESIDPQDWSEGVTADTIVARVIQQDALGNIILLHDAGGDASRRSGRSRVSSRTSGSGGEGLWPCPSSWGRPGTRSCLPSLGTISCS